MSQSQGRGRSIRSKTPPKVEDLSTAYFSGDDACSDNKKVINEFDMLSRLCEHEVLSRAEERLLLERYHKPDSPADRRDEAFQLLVSSNIKLIMKVAKYYSDTWKVPIEDLVQEGTVGLIRAIQGFDLSKNVKLSTYATSWIRQSISRQSPVLARNIRLPAHAITALHKIDKKRNELEIQFRRSPSDQEIADALKMPLNKLQLLLVVEGDTASTNERVGTQKDLELGDLVADKPDPHEPEKARIIKDALGKLTPDQRSVLKYRHDDRLGIPEIASITGNSIGVVRSILRAAELQLKHLLAPHEQALTED